MSRLFWHVMNKGGNVVTLWVASLPIFALLFAFIGTLVTIWMTHSSSQMAADAASLAATQKMDAWVHQAMSEELSHADGTDLSTDAQKRDFMLRVISGHDRGLQNVAREYVQKYGGDEKFDLGEVSLIMKGSSPEKAELWYRGQAEEEEMPRIITVEMDREKKQVLRIREQDRDSKIEPVAIDPKKWEN